MKIFVFLANGFEEIEAIAPIDIFRRAQIDVTTVSIYEIKEVTSAHGITVQADSIFSETDFSGEKLLYLPGGMPGTKNLDEHDGLKKLLQSQADKNNPIAAICAAPSILGKMGLLDGKEAICYPGFEELLTGATISKDKLVKTGNINMAKAAGVAIPFALKIVEELKGKDQADKVANSICY